jgi:hypothetical protein
VAAVPSLNFGDTIFAVVTMAVLAQSVLGEFI